MAGSTAPINTPLTSIICPLKHIRIDSPSLTSTRQSWNRLCNKNDGTCGCATDHEFSIRTENVIPYYTCVPICQAPSIRNNYGQCIRSCGSNERLNQRTGECPCVANYERLGSSTTCVAKCEAANPYTTNAPRNSAGDCTCSEGAELLDQYYYGRICMPLCEEGLRRNYWGYCDEEWER
ncbi:unnamed protein product [Cercospora beticola]|nr:unnamed protein product [Cercospora beticola]